MPAQNRAPIGRRMSYTVPQDIYHIPLRWRDLTFFLRKLRKDVLELWAIFGCSPADLVSRAVDVHTQSQIDKSTLVMDGPVRLQGPLICILRRRVLLHRDARVLPADCATALLPAFSLYPGRPL